MSSFFKWRMFNFFGVSKDVDDGAIRRSLEPHHGTCAASGRGHLLFGDSDGRVHLVSRDLRAPPAVFRAFQRQTRLLHAAGGGGASSSSSGLLLAVGEDDPGVNPYLKVFDLDAPDKNGDPTLLRVSRVALTGRVSEPTALAADGAQTLLALAYADGSVVLHRGDVRRERGSRRKTLVEGGRGEAVSGLAFRTTSKAALLYVATDGGVRCFCISDRAETAVTLDNVGCKPGLAIAAENMQDTHFVTGRQDAVYCYTPEGRSQCYAFEGEKVALHWFRHYLVVVTQDSGKRGSSSAMSAAAASASSPEDERQQTLTVFDVQNKFVAFTAPLGRPAKWVLSEWGLLFAVSDDGDCRLFQLTEKDIQTKLDVLFKKNFYDVAVKVAKMQHYDEDGLVDIFRQYGDHLYSKGDFTGAIENYVKTIGHLEPSYVIRKFLDASKIHHLTEYLQELHSQGLANEDHTTLLLNCYTKLKDQNKLNEFILTEGTEVNFDVDIAIKVCRQSGYNQHALRLAERHGRHEWYLKLQLEDTTAASAEDCLKRHREALAYIARLEFEEAESNMRRYGATLMQKLPTETTELLKRLCTDYKPDGAPLITKQQVEGEDGDEEEEEVLAAHAEHFLPLFVRNSAQMVDFLEFMLRARPADGQALRGVNSTLLEHYLHQYSDPSATANARKKMEERAMDVLRRGVHDEDGSSEEDQALILCQRHAFSQGALYLYERRGMFDEILGHHVNRGDVSAVVATCRRFGARQPDLWVAALQFIAREGEADQQQIEEILDNIEKHRLLSPILIVSTLAKSSTATLKLIRGYLSRLMEAEDRQTKKDQEVIDKYKVETAAIRKENEKLKKEAVIFQESKCSACGHALELPSVHFLCLHSYHEHCFQSYSETDSECPACKPHNKKIMDIIKSQEKSKDNHDEFHYQLEKAENSFEVVAEYFGRGIFRRQEEESSQMVARPPPEQQQPNFDRLETGPGGAEGRMRAEEEEAARRRAGGGGASRSARGYEDPSTSEARLRSQPGPPPPTTGSEIKSEARLRLEHDAARIHRTRQPSPAGTAAAAAAQQLHPPAKPSPSLPRAANEAAASNPFGDPDEDANNPFTEGKGSTIAKTGAAAARPSGGGGAASNPFGEPEDDYDDKLNPFGES